MADGSIKLNKKQKEAVEHGEGPLLIIAGAGTGKTTVITERIKYLILHQNILPSEILALTFTEKAASEMEERVDVALPYGYTQMWISTFHSFGDRILRDEALQIGLDPGYRVMTEAEAIRFMREHLFDFDLKYFRPLGNPTKFLSGMLQHFFRLKDEDISPAQYLRWAQLQQKSKKVDRLEAEKWLELSSAYQKYEDLKTKEGVMDFADLISNTLRLFRERPNVLKQYQERFKYILVDEFQDTNIAQNELVKMLAGKKANLTVVADDDQSIYRWRGAATSNVIQFRKTYPQAKIVALTHNYRSTQQILDAAYRLIQNNNPDRLEVQEGINKKLISVKKASGIPPVLLKAGRVEDEAEVVATKILELVREGRSYSDFAILVRANNHSEPFVRALTRHGIPYQFLGPGQLFRRPEIKELFAYLKVLYNFEDSTAFYKVLTMGEFGIDARDIAALLNYARRHNLTLFEAAEKADDVFLSKQGRKKIKKLVKIVYRHLGRIKKDSAGQILYYFLEDSGLIKSLIKPKSEEEERKAQNIAKFFDKIKTYETEHEDASIFAVVDWIELSLELGESPLAADFDWQKENAVNILTVHSAKGLEFPVVFIVNLVDQRFPTRERREQIPIPQELIKEVLPTGDYHLQEERRLFYVALTRAKDMVFLTTADYYGEGKRERKPSPFIEEALGKNKEAAEENVQQLSILDFAPPPLVKQESQRKHFSVNFLSYSRINTFQICPLHYKLMYMLNVPAVPSVSQNFGTVLHDTLNTFYRRIRQGGRADEKELLAIYEALWIPEGYASKSHEQRMKARGREYLVEYLKTDLHKKGLPEVLEWPFSFYITPDLKIGGRIDRIDRIDNGIEIIDYKTTDLLDRQLPDEKELARNLQLSIYALAVEYVKHPLFETDKVVLSLFFLDRGIKVSTVRTKKQLEQARKEILEWRRKIEISDFSCSGNFWCKSCEYKLFCEAH